MIYETTQTAVGLQGRKLLRRIQVHARAIPTKLATLRAHSVLNLKSVRLALYNEQNSNNKIRYAAPVGMGVKVARATIAQTYG